MNQNRPSVISIAGFDPSGGAGVLADIKTFEQHRVNGFGVLSANTVQCDTVVYKVNWGDVSVMKHQLRVLLEKWQVQWFKIGIIENSAVLLDLVQFIRTQNPSANFIWDPVLRSSSGFPFITQSHDLHELLNYMAIITPNLPEFSELIENEEKALHLSKKIMIYLKGGHSEISQGRDTLFWNGTTYSFEPEKIGYAKHGSGCVLSAAIAANFALGHQAPSAFEKAKQYIETVLTSNSSLLGWHT